MNWWLIGLSVAVMLLWIRQLGAAHRWNSLVKTLSAFTEVIGAIGDIPPEKAQEVQKVWAEARINAEKNMAYTSVFVFGFVIFLIALMIHGKI